VTETISVDAVVSAAEVSPNGQAADPAIRTRDKVCIVGFADGHRAEAPNGPEYDDSFEYWGINRLHAVMPDRTWSRYFEIHDLEQFYAEDDQHKKFLHDFAGPVYIRADDMGRFDIPNAVPFPKELMLETFGSYFTNTISWLLALAIFMEYKEIHVYGVDMAQDQLLQAEYSHQRPSCEFFLGVATGRGIEVVLPKGSDLLTASHLYGYESSEGIRGKWESRLAELGQRKAQMHAELAKIDNQRGQLIAGVNQMDGAMQECTYNIKNHLTPEATP
jgi:hypothetical protein